MSAGRRPSRSVSLTGRMSDELDPPEELLDRRQHEHPQPGLGGHRGDVAEEAARRARRGDQHRGGAGRGGDGERGRRRGLPLARPTGAGCAWRVVVDHRRHDVRGVGRRAQRPKRPARRPRRRRPRPRARRRRRSGGCGVRCRARHIDRIAIWPNTQTPVASSGTERGTGRDAADARRSTRRSSSRGRPTSPSARRSSPRRTCRSATGGDTARRADRTHPAATTATTIARITWRCQTRSRSKS